MHHSWVISISTILDFCAENLIMEIIVLKFVLIMVIILPGYKSFYSNSHFSYNSYQMSCSVYTSGFRRWRNVYNIILQHWKMKCFIYKIVDAIHNFSRSLMHKQLEMLRCVHNTVATAEAPGHLYPPWWLNIKCISFSPKYYMSVNSIGKSYKYLIH